MVVEVHLRSGETQPPSRTYVQLNTTGLRSNSQGSDPPPFRHLPSLVVTRLRLRSETVTYRHTRGETRRDVVDTNLVPFGVLCESYLRLCTPRDTTRS